MLGNPMEIAALVGVAVLLFGADKLPKLARSAGEMRREFHRGHEEGNAAPTVTPADHEPESPSGSTGSSAPAP